MSCFETVLLWMLIKDLLGDGGVDADGVVREPDLAVASVSSPGLRGPLLKVCRFLDFLKSML
jgi:hypothetical protein